MVGEEVERLKRAEIPEADFSDVEIERLKVVADDAAIDEALGNLAETAQNFEDKDGAAEEGDQVVIDFLGLGSAFQRHRWTWCSWLLVLFFLRLLRCNRYSVISFTTYTTFQRSYCWAWCS